MFYINNTIFSALVELIMFVHVIPSSVLAAEWPPLGKELLTGLSISMFPLFFFNFSPVSVLFSSSFPIHIIPNLDPIIFGPSFHIQCIFTYDNYLFIICFLYYIVFNWKWKSHVCRRATVQLLCDGL